MIKNNTVAHFPFQGKDPGGALSRFFHQYPGAVAQGNSLDNALDELTKVILAKCPHTCLSYKITLYLLSPN